ncbi:MAG: LytR C-terminal domain-containing protein, partial [Gaiellaceae bacterium]
GPSTLELARARRGLNREAAAALTALSVDEITWLEEGRLYRFRSAHGAVAAATTYAAALDIEHREALELAGRPVPPRPASRRSRFIVLGGVALVLLVVIAAVGAVSQLGGGSESSTSAQLPPTWNIQVDVFNGGGDIAYTRKVADEINGLAYHLGPVRKADNFDYTETAVYYPPGAEALAQRLGDSLCVDAKPLPGGKDRRRLVVVAGPASVSNC